MEKRTTMIIYKIFKLILFEDTTGLFQRIDFEAANQTLKETENSFLEIELIKNPLGGCIFPENFLSKTRAIEKDRNSKLRLIGFSDDVCYLIDYDNIEPDPVWYSVSCHCHSINQAVSVLYGIPKVDYEFITAID